MGPTGPQGHDAGGPSGPVPPVRRGVPADAPAAARLHASQIDQGFLSSLGPAFLTRLYRRIATTPESFLLVVDDPARAADDPVVGFIAGSAAVGRLYRTFLVRDGLAAALPAAPRLLRSWRRVVETLGHAGEDGAGVGRGPELLAVAVDPAATGRGLGGRLVEAFLAEAAVGGHSAAHVVVGADNDRAVALYRRAGFVEAGRFELHAGTTSLLMQWDAPGAADDADGAPGAAADVDGASGAADDVDGASGAAADADGAPGAAADADGAR